MDPIAAPEPTAYRLLLRPLPGPVPVAIRLRRLLKYALRVCGFRCIECEEAQLPSR